MSAATTRLLLITLAFLSLLVLTAADEPPHDDTILELDNTSNGQPAAAKDGQTIYVKLEDDAGDGYTVTYAAPTSSDEAVVAANKPDGGEPGEPGKYSFKAIGADTDKRADITAEGTCVEADPAADPRKCPDPVSEWKVTVAVAAKEAAP